MMWWRRKKPERKMSEGGTYWDGRVWVANMGFQCEVCGVPTDAAQCVDTKGRTAWIRVDPCGHVISVPIGLSA